MRARRGQCSGTGSVVSTLRTLAALTNHIGRARVGEEGRQPSGQSNAFLGSGKYRGGLFLDCAFAKGEAEPPLLMALLDSWPQPLVGLGSTDRCAYGVSPE